MMCFAFYKGKGYSPEFTLHMDELYARLQDENIVLVEGCEQVCEACPNQTKGHKCLSQEKVEELDQNILNAQNNQKGGVRL